MGGVLLAFLALAWCPRSAGASSGGPRKSWIHGSREGSGFAQVKLEKRSAAVGEPVKLFMRLPEVCRGQRFRFEPPDFSVAGFSESPRPLGGFGSSVSLLDVWLTRNYVLRPKRAGKAAVPALLIQCRDRAGNSWRGSTFRLALQVAAPAPRPQSRADARAREIAAFQSRVAELQRAIESKAKPPAADLAPGPAQWDSSPPDPPQAPPPARPSVPWGVVVAAVLSAAVAALWLLLR